ncbi:hypothetical protein GcC1_193003 [Golovinomyces cichoracearum]|uniref:Uncharacterized protein n=1 Tax=Golovinomyces cichoracearum TaxID=62708 RepID=A0A420HHK3_9PEZI|nr:hypothetical protein GcC1_193003 [Golovinomyces cichoracearum]
MGHVSKNNIPSAEFIFKYSNTQFIVARDSARNLKESDATEIFLPHFKSSYELLYGRKCII